MISVLFSAAISSMSCRILPCVRHGPHQSAKKSSNTGPWARLIASSLLKAKQLHQALDIPAAPPPGVTLHLYAGDAIETPAVMSVDIHCEFTRWFCCYATMIARLAVSNDRRIGIRLGLAPIPQRFGIDRPGPFGGI